jgi:hypothetical protein
MPLVGCSEFDELVEVESSVVMLNSDVYDSVIEVSEDLEETVVVFECPMAQQSVIVGTSRPGGMLRRAGKPQAVCQQAPSSVPRQHGRDVWVAHSDGVSRLVDEVVTSEVVCEEFEALAADKDTRYVNHDKSSAGNIF